ncbi:winged helix-turn-helix domain-containing protein [Nocardia sp. NBC_01730]|uniref:ArsR/SmtB family transcription factor n=1 Tax=Nocardia sp. NBC_01730 TaxID=2975998 RepID=UPI002E0F0EF1|nr:winged helix-turn-helix domain-containing protein [Nocardia sp. NBC_01730]
MVVLRLSPGALSRCRFVISPLAETIGSLIVLQRRTANPALAQWCTQHYAAYREWLSQDEVAAGLLPLLATTNRLPGVVTPPQAGVRTRLADELAQVAAHSDEYLRAVAVEAVAACQQPPDTQWLSSDRLGERVAEVLRAGWKRFVATDWRRRRAVLERDIAYRTSLLADHGLRHAVETMQDGPVWFGDDAIVLNRRPGPDRWIGDDGLVFVPRTTSGGWWVCKAPPRYGLIYSAFGAAAPTATSVSEDPLSVLLGAGRARVLRELVRPATSSQLAVILDVSLGTVSSHLSVLRDADMVTRARVGRIVVYRLTDRGTRLLTVLEPAP